MLHLLDANVLIDANRDYYPIDRVPEFWEWLIAMGQADSLKVPEEVYEEVTAGTDLLATWLKGVEATDALLLKEEASAKLVSEVTIQGYAPDLNDVELVKIGRDPFLISYGLVSLGQRTVVTTEGSKPKTQRANRRVPDVCAQLKIPCINTFALLKALNFTTDWKAKK